MIGVPPRGGIWYRGEEGSIRAGLVDQMSTVQWWQPRDLDVNNL